MLNKICIRQLYYADSHDSLVTAAMMVSIISPVLISFTLSVRGRVGNRRMFHVWFQDKGEYF